MGGRKLGAYSILSTMILGLTHYATNLVTTEIPELKLSSKVHETKIQNNIVGIKEIRMDLKELRNGQNKILEILIKRNERN